MSVSEATLLRWRREIIKGTATEVIERRLVAYVRNLVDTIGIQPASLMCAYFKVAHKFPRK